MVSAPRGDECKQKLLPFIGPIILVIYTRQAIEFRVDCDKGCVFQGVLDLGIKLCEIFVCYAIHFVVMWGWKSAM